MFLLLPNVTDGEAKLTQSPEGIAAGKKLNIAGALALVEFARLSKDKLDLELVGALTAPKDYLAQGRLPAPTSGAVSAPTWTNAYREAQTGE